MDEIIVGGVTYEAKPSEFTCAGCAFREEAPACRTDCMSYNREDKQFIIWVKKEQVQ